MNNENLIIKKLKEYDLNPCDLNIFEKIVQHYKDIVGEENNVKLVFLSAISRKLPKNLRIHVVNNSNSGTGKSWIAEKVLKPFWHDVEVITRFTEAWLNRASDELDEKIVLWQEINKQDNKGEGTTGQIKLLLSENGISYRITQNVEGKWIPQEIKSNALPVIITTTTQSINIEDARRFFVIETDESEEQTNRIIQHNLRKASSPKFEAEIANSNEQLEILAGFYDEMAEKIDDILIPFGTKLAENLPKYLQMRTNITRIIQITKLLAFVNVQNRKWLVVNENNMVKNYLVADIEDFNQAMIMLGRTMTKANNDLSQGSMKLLEILQKFQNYEIERNTPQILLLDVYENIPPSISDCIKAMNIPRATFYTYLDPLRDKGYVEDVRYPHCKQTFIALTEQHIQEFSIKELEFSENELKEWIENEFGNKASITNFTNESS